MAYDRCLNNNIPGRAGMLQPRELTRPNHVRICPTSPSERSYTHFKGGRRGIFDTFKWNCKSVNKLKSTDLNCPIFDMCVRAPRSPKTWSPTVMIQFSYFSVLYT